MGFSSILGWVGLGISAVSAVGNFIAAKGQSDALDNLANERRKAQDLEIKKNNIRERRERLRIVRDARIKRAAAISAATVQGAQGSVRGAFGSFISQLGSGTQYINQLSRITSEQNSIFDTATAYAAQARKYGERASIFQGIGNVGATIFNNREDIEGLFN